MKTPQKEHNKEDNENTLMTKLVLLHHFHSVTGESIRQFLGVTATWSQCYGLTWHEHMASIPV